MRTEIIKKGTIIYTAAGCYTVKRIIDGEKLECTKEFFSPYTGELLKTKNVVVERSEIENRGFSVPVQCVFKVE